MEQTAFRLPPELTSGSRLARAAVDLRRLLAVAVACLRISGIPEALRRRGRDAPRSTVGQRVRESFERLGLTYLKLGQFLAMRSDLLPRSVCEELERLFDHVEPVPFDDVRELVESEFGVPLETLYPSFARAPIAAASVAQVHEATTAAGERVAVKVQRPGIEWTFAADMRNLWRVARLADALGLLGRLSAREVALEFMTWTAGELDFVNEARTAERVRASALPYELVPRLHWTLISRRVLTMEFVEGLSLTEVVRLLEEGGEPALRERLPGVDLRLTLRRFANASLRQIFVTGFFHGDPHPGNILIRADNKVAFVDFGIFGTLNPYHRDLMLGMVESIAVGDIDRAFRCYAAIGDATEETDVDAFERAAKSVLERWYTAATDSASAIDERHLGRYVSDVLELVRRHRIRLSWDTLLFWRTLHALDTSGLKFPDHFDLLAELGDFFTRNAGPPERRVAEVLSDDDRQLRVMKVQRELPEHVRVLRAVAGGTLPWRPDLDEDRRERRRRDAGAKAMAAATLALSSVVVATASTAAPAILVGAAALAPALAIASVRKARA